MSGHIRQRSAGSWELRYHADGKTCTKTIRGNRRDAQAALRAALSAVDRGEHVAPQKLAVAEHVRARVAQWQASGRISGRTAETYGTLAGEIAAQIGAVPLQKLTTLDVEQWHTSMHARGLTRTASAAHTLLARALADGVKHRLLSRNVARDQGPPARKQSIPMPTLLAEQIPELLARLKQPWRVPVITALYTGIRRGEQLALRWHRVDLDAREIQIVEALDETTASGIAVKAPKSAAGARAVSLPAIMVDALRAHRREQLERCMLLGLGRPPEDALVFPADDGGYDSPNAFTLRWGRAAARLGIPEITWHSLRHTHASMLIRAGVDVVTVSRRLGHADPSVTLRIYAHLYTADDRSAAEAIDRALQ